MLAWRRAVKGESLHAFKALMRLLAIDVSPSGTACLRCRKAQCVPTASLSEPGEPEKMAYLRYSPEIRSCPFGRAAVASYGRFGENALSEPFQSDCVGPGANTLHGR